MIRIYADDFGLRVLIHNLHGPAGVSDIRYTLRIRHHRSASGEALTSCQWKRSRRPLGLPAVLAVLGGFDGALWPDLLLSFASVSSAEGWGSDPPFYTDIIDLLLPRSRVFAPWKGLERKF